MPCLRRAAGIEPHIGGGKAELAPALVAVDDLAADEPRIAEQLGGLGHLAGGERGADRARATPGGRRPRTAARCRPRSRGWRLARRDSRASRCASRRNGNRSRSRRRRPPAARTRMRATKSSAESCASAASKRSTIAPSSPVAASSRSFAALVGQPEQRLVRPKEAARMRLEGQRRRRPAERAGRAASAAAITARWPRCTPSKLPMATTAPRNAMVCGRLVAHHRERSGRLPAVGHGDRLCERALVLRVVNNV